MITQVGWTIRERARTLYPTYTISIQCTLNTMQHKPKNRFIRYLYINIYATALQTDCKSHKTTRARTADAKQAETTNEMKMEFVIRQFDWIVQCTNITRNVPHLLCFLNCVVLCKHKRRYDSMVSAVDFWTENCLWLFLFKSRSTVHCILLYQQYYNITRSERTYIRSCVVR